MPGNPQAGDTDSDSNDEDDAQPKPGERQPFLFELVFRFIN
jgi:hypothetical protein